MNDKLRNLMHQYLKRLERLEQEYQEAKEHDEDTWTSECLLRQCRIMIAELWHVMVELDVLDKEEIEFGSMKKERYN